MSGIWRDRSEHRPWVERVTGLDTMLRSVSPQRAKAFLAWVLYGASDELIGEKLGVTPAQARRLVSLGASSLRHPSHHGDIRDYLDTDGQTLLIDKGLRALIREWRLEETFAPECRQCGRRYTVERARDPWMNAGGRPRQYCSNACRQKAYRDRRR
ncbi:hypothetical protein ACFU93_32300 [Streptomyces sp. NPDC057611]|uniref:hypothetical protein n=1 Tax=Streptomyces sp. NPDC057611 TaxID=3346182 RepID=UPI0036BB663E